MRRPIGILATLRALILLLPFIVYSIEAKSQETTGGSSNQSVFAAYEFYGRAPYPGNALGGRAGYIFSNRQELSLTYVTSKQDLLLTSFSYNEYALVLSFWLNEYIYLSIGGGHRTVTINSQVFTEPFVSGEPSVAQEVSEIYKVLTGNMALGFEIPIFSNLVIGAEVFGLSSPIHWIKKSSNYPDNAADYEEDPKSYPYIRDGLKSNYHLMRSFVKVRL
jgi:hypothetical protein